jgi:hypothetical protein
MLLRCVEFRDVLPSDRSLDMHFDAFMKDDVGMVRRIYALADQPFAASVESGMQRFMSDHPRGRHGGVLYDLSEFGLDRGTLREAFRDYVDRFGVAEERVAT